MAVDKNKDESDQGLNDYTPKSKDQLQAEKRKRDLNPTLLKNVINSKSAQIINKVMCAKMLANKQIQEQFGLNDQIANQVLFGKKKDNTKASKTLKNQFLPGCGHKDETEKYAKIVAEFSDNMDMIIAANKNATGTDKVDESKLTTLQTYVEQKFEKSGKIITRETREDRRNQLEAAKKEYSNKNNTQQNTEPSNTGGVGGRPSFDTSNNLPSSENKNGPSGP